MAAPLRNASYGLWTQQEELEVEDGRFSPAIQPLNAEPVTEVTLTSAQLEFVLGASGYLLRPKSQRKDSAAHASLVEDTQKVLELYQKYGSLQEHHEKMRAKRRHLFTQTLVPCVVSGEDIKVRHFFHDTQFQFFVCPTKDKLVLVYNSRQPDSSHTISIDGIQREVEVTAVKVFDPIGGEHGYAVKGTNYKDLGFCDVDHSYMSAEELWFRTDPLEKEIELYRQQAKTQEKT